MTALAPSMQAYFTERLIGQRDASPNTIAAYRTTFRLLLTFAAARTATAPSKLDLDQLDAPLISAFLDHLERQRGNCSATRNNRLAAIHSLFSYLALRHPEHAGSIQRVLAIPAKRTERRLLTYLTDPEADALLAACDQQSWTGRRDHALFALTLQTGLRISEVVGLTRSDVTLSTGAHVHTIGKGRKQRRTPLIPTTKAVLKAWLAELGLRPGQARSTALFGLAAELPAALLARLLGISISVAVAWQRASSGDWTNYAADYSRRSNPNNNAEPTHDEVS